MQICQKQRKRHGMQHDYEIPHTEFKRICSTYKLENGDLKLSCIGQSTNWTLSHRPLTAPDFCFGPRNIPIQTRPGRDWWGFQFRIKADSPRKNHSVITSGCALIRIPIFLSQFVAEYWFHGSWKLPHQMNEFLGTIKL